MIQKNLNSKYRLIKNFSKYFLIFIFSALIITSLGGKIIIESKFKLDAMNIQSVEKLTSEVFKFTNHYKGLIDHNKLLSNKGFTPLIDFDNKILSYSSFFYQTILNYFNLDGYLCGGHSKYLSKILLSQNLKSFVYNHGNHNSGFSHVVVVVEIDNKLYIFDPTYNIVYKSGENYLSLDELFNIVSQKQNLKDYIHIINKEDKVFNLKEKEMRNYSVENILSFFDKYKLNGNKEHILLDSLGMYSSPDINMEYFYKKYPYLNNL